MITVVLASRCPKITLTDDRTFEDVCIECRDYDEEKELLIKLVDRLLRTDREE